jgi:outer membrane protein, heavy metal efflux system
MKRSNSPQKPIASRCWTRSCSAASCAVLLLGAARARAETGLQEIPSTLRVCTASPAQAVARAEQAQGRATVEAARVLPNPSLVLQDNQTLEGASDRETIIGLSVPLGIGGRRFVLQDAARVHRDQARAQARATVFEAAVEYRTAFARIVLDRARVMALESGQRDLDELVSMIRGLQQRGETARYDLWRLNAEARTHRRRVASQRARLVADRATLSAWLDGAVEVGDVSPRDLAGGNSVDRSTLAPAASPRVEALRAAARASRIEERAAHRRWVPDLQVFAGYRNVSAAGVGSGHGVSLSLGIPIVLFDHGQGDAIRASADAELASARAERLTRENRAQISAARARLRILGASLSDADAAVTDTANVMRQARKLYAGGETSITELLATARDAEAAALARIDVVEEIVAARLALMGAAGTQFDATLDRACGGRLR